MRVCKSDVRMLVTMQDTSAYTGSHKERFDAEGNGLSLEGRDSVAKGAGNLPGGGQSLVGPTGN